MSDAGGSTARRKLDQQPSKLAQQKAGSDYEAAARTQQQGDGEQEQQEAAEADEDQLGGRHSQRVSSSAGPCAARAQVQCDVVGLSQKYIECTAAAGGRQTSRLMCVRPS